MGSRAMVEHQEHLPTGQAVAEAPYVDQSDTVLSRIPVPLCCCMYALSSMPEWHYMYLLIPASPISQLLYSLTNRRFIGFHRGAAKPHG